MASISKTTPDHFQSARMSKLIELIIISIIDIVFLSILISNENLKSAVFGNKYIFIFCAIAWVVLIINLVFILIDFNTMRNAASKTVELTHEAYNDSLTGLPNRHSIDLMLKLQARDNDISDIGCILLRITNIQKINSEFGHEVGDLLIRDFCHLLISSSSSYGFVGRNGGNDFLGIFEHCGNDTIPDFISDLMHQIKMYNLDHSSTPIEVEYSYVHNSEENVAYISDLLTLVYRKIEDAPQA